MEASCQNSRSDELGRAECCRERICEGLLMRHFPTCNPRYVNLVSPSSRVLTSFRDSHADQPKMVGQRFSCHSCKKDRPATVQDGIPLDCGNSFPTGSRSGDLSLLPSKYQHVSVRSHLWDVNGALTSGGTQPPLIMAPSLLDTTLVKPLAIGARIRKVSFTQASR